MTGRRFSTFPYLPVCALFSLGITLSGCATDALELAPSAPDKPWVAGEKDAKNKTVATDATAKSGAADFGVASNPELALISTPVEVDNRRSYDLPALIDLAQRSNPTTRNAWERAKQAALAVGMTEAVSLPMISANVIGGYQKSKRPVDVPIVGDKDIDSTVKGVVPALALKWLVFDFGQRAALRDAAREVSFAANVTFNALHQKVIFDVTRRYYEHSAAVTGHQIAQQTLRNSKAVLAAVQAKLNEGRATTIELALARQQVAQAELRIVRANGQEQNTYQLLLAGMGVNATLDLKIKGALDRKIPSRFDGVTQEVIEAALSRRPDIQAGYAAMQASQAGIRVAQAEFMPKVFIAATLSKPSGDFNIGALPDLNSQSSSKGVIVGASMPIFDGGLRAAQLKNAQSVANVASETFRKMQLDAVAEIVLASNALKTALAANNAANTLVQTSNVAFDASLEAYKNGLGTITMVNETNNALLDARLAQADAKAAAFIAAANLAFFAGALTSSDQATNLSQLPGVATP
ncbi:TolC family protein [Paenochrobactrum glaciei]|uniref:Protein CyaE n=1 Tax=Paenochrobactrum glaciei TaxID=486407 RepID=A0ABN1GIR1_9HYPH